MKNHPFKNFIAYTVGGTIIPQLMLAARHQYEQTNDDLLEKLAELAVTDPGSTAWRSVGFIPPMGVEDQLLVDIEPGTYLLAVQHNERILPGKVRDERVLERVREIEEREGRKIGRREYAQLREEAEIDLLPRAFIRRTNVYVMFTQSLLFIFTSSAKRADDTMAKLIELLGQGSGIRVVSTILQPGELLTNVARDVVSDDNDEFALHATDAAALSGQDKRTIRIKDRDIYGGEVQDLIGEGYVPTELRICMSNSDDELLEFSLNDKLFFKRVQFTNTYLDGREIGEDAYEQFIAFTLLVARDYSDLTSTVVALLGGLLKPSEKKDAPAVTETEDHKHQGFYQSSYPPADDEDDEL